MTYHVCVIGAYYILTLRIIEIYSQLVYIWLKMDDLFVY